MTEHDLLIADRGRVAAQMEHLRYRNVPQSKVTRLPTEFSNVNEITRAATRKTDQPDQVEELGYVPWRSLAILGFVTVVLFVLVIEFGIFD